MTAPKAPVEVAGRYRLLQRVGAGGMGVVWRGYDERLGRDVAVKRLLPGVVVDESEAEVAGHRAMREARITARLHHPHAVAVYDVVEHEGQPCLVMEYYPSSSLADLVASGRRLSVAEVARIGGEVASALAAAHRAGIVHRDVKPGNVLVGPDGAAKISDFGISHAMGDVSLTSTGLVTGTPAYLAPEVARGETATAASDVFSLGSTLYTVLEGRPPFGWHENAMAMLHRVASGEIDAPQRSGPLSRLLASMLAARAQDRPDMKEVAHRLADVDLEAAVATPVAPAVPPAAGSARTRAMPREASLPVAVPAPADVEAAGEDPAVGEAPAPQGGSWPFAERSGAAARSVDLPPADGAPTGPGRRRSPRVLLALVAVAVLGVLAVVLATRDDRPDAGDPAAASLSASAPATPSAAPSTAAPTTSAPTPSTEPTRSPSPSPSSTPRPSTSAPPSATSPPSPRGGAPTSAQLRDAVTGYYAFLPGDRDAAWNRLTARYQSTTARSRGYFDSFWGRIDAVRASDVSASAPDTVTATLTYDYANGKVFVERTRYRLVEDDGILKIDRSDVLSSVQR